MRREDFLKTKIYGYRTYEEAKEKFEWSQAWELFDGNEEGFNIAHECIDRHPAEETAVRIKFEDGHVEEYNFGFISTLSSQFANALESRGINFGDRVAIMLDPSLEFYVSLFGTLKRGAIVVPCFNQFGPEALNQRLEDSQARMLVTTVEKAKLADDKSLDTVRIGHLFQEILAKENNRYEPKTAVKDFAVYQYTSGTTRKYAEAVKHYHRSIVNLMPAAIFGRGVKKGDKFFCPSSPAWGYGLWIGTFAPLALGVAVGAYSGKFDARRLLEALEQFEINNFSAAPTVFRMIRESRLVDQYKFKINKIHYSGEPIDLDTFNFVKETFGVSPVSGYGSTEVGPIIYNYAGFDNWLVKPGSLGKPMPGIEVKVINDTGKETANGQIGEIAIKRRGEWFRAKDAAVVDEDGYFWHKGRVDDIIISAAWTISPNEVEDVLLKHRAVKEVAVLGIPDKERGQIVKAFIVPNVEPNLALKKELQDFVKDRLSKHEYPREIEFMGALPKTEAGKIKRKELKERGFQKP
ncbi:MAG: AMP-binding protein [Thermodesulfobacteriota bacterium]